MEPDTIYLKNMVIGLVSHKEDVVVTRTVDNIGVFLTISVHKDDMGLIIGREGSTATSIRTLMRAYGMKTLARINVKINEPK